MTDSEELHGRLDGKACSLILAQNKFTLKIPTYGVDARVALNQQPITDPLVVLLASGKTATLRNNYYAGHRGHIGPTEAFILQQIGANMVIIGEQEFAPGDLIDSIRFRPTNEVIAEYYIRHRGHARLPQSRPIEANEFFGSGDPAGNIIVNAVDPGRARICEIKLGAIDISLEIVVSESFTCQGGRIEEERVTTISYGDPVSLDVALQDVICICNFYSFVIGEIINPKEIRIASGKIGEFGRRPTFDIHTALRAAGADLDPQNAIRCLMSAQFDGARYQESLLRWFERRGDWQKAYAAMWQSLSRQNEITRHRYLDALNWFEAIPSFYDTQRTLVDVDVLRSAATCVSEIFQEKGIAISADRVRQLLTPLNTPSLAMRLRSAFTYLRKRFGPTVLPPRAEDLISRMTSTRGTLAHGDNEVTLGEAREFYELTLLAETICRLLSLSSLDWDFDRLASAHYHPMQMAVQTLQLYDQERSPGKV